MDTYASPSPRLPPGTRLNGIFEVERLIASGGMGEIYRGHVIETGDPVAIKVMRLDVADNAMALALFRKEASALHNIHHEAIVRYYLFSHDPGTGRHYLIMEFVDGLPLSDLLQQGPLDVGEEKIQEEVKGKLKKGVRLTGTVSGSGDGMVALLLANHDGYVFNWSGALKPDGATQTFEQKIFKDTTGTQPQLLIAIVSSKPLDALNFPWNGADGIQAEGFFPQMRTEAAITGQTLLIRAKYVKLAE